MNISRRYSPSRQRKIALRVYGRQYRKRKGIKTCHCHGWWFPRRAGSEPVYE